MGYDKEMKLRVLILVLVLACTPKGVYYNKETVGLKGTVDGERWISPYAIVVNSIHEAWEKVEYYFTRR